jgi:hypothetical protein
MNQHPVTMTNLLNLTHTTPNPLPANLTVPFEPILLVMPDRDGQIPLAGHSFNKVLTAEKFNFSLISD